jgi:glycosyltransferase involved in cell wall biosynthesis
VMTAHDYKLACPAYKMFDGKAVCEDCRGGRVLPLLRKRCVHNSAALSALVALESTLHRELGYYERYVDRIVCPSQFLREKLAEWGWPRERLVHIGNFFDAAMWTPRFTPGRYALYFGRLAPEKGLSTLLRSCALANCAVKIVGWGSERDALRDEAARSGVTAEFIEHVPPRVLGALINDARCVVVPSEWYENASLAILEAFACGKPVIAARIGGNPELIREGVNGWLFEPKNVQALAACLQRLWCMPDSEVERFGRTAHASVQERHGAEGYYEAMTGLYRQLDLHPYSRPAVRAGLPNRAAREGNVP